MPLHSRVLPLLVLLCFGCEDNPPELSPKDRAEGYYMQGTASYLQGRFDEAQKSFDAMKELTPEDPRLPAAYGELFLSMGRLKEASDAFQQALAKDSKRSTNWSRLGFIQSQLGQLDEATSSLRKALALHPNDFNALSQLGEIHLKRGEKDAAVEHFQLAAAASPEVLKPALVLQASLVLTQQERHADALALLEKWVGQGLKDAEVLTALGDEQVRAGQLPAAAASYRQAALLSPRDPSVWELVGEIALKLDKPGDALEAYRESLRVQDRAVVHVSIARIHLARKELDAAKEELERALGSVSGSDERELTELVELLETMDRKPDALRILTHLAAEPEKAGDVALQLRTARLAKELKDTVTVQAACARIQSGDAGPRVERCP